MTNQYPDLEIILASASPRRRELLTSLGLAYRVEPSAYPEPPIDGATPAQLALIHAIEKARDVAQRFAGRLVLAADTVVDLEGEALGKPRDAADACAMLKRLAGRWHDVHTGFAFVRDQECVAECVTTEVEMRTLTDEQVAAYVATGDPLDKAGSYGIQGRGAINIAGIRGDYSTVMGLPVGAVWRALERFFA